MPPKGKLPPRRKITRKEAEEEFSEYEGDAISHDAWLKSHASSLMRMNGPECKTPFDYWCKYIANVMLYDELTDMIKQKTVTGVLKAAQLVEDPELVKARFEKKIDQPTSNKKDHWMWEGSTAFLRRDDDGTPIYLPRFGEGRYAPVSTVDPRRYARNTYRPELSPLQKHDRLNYNADCPYLCVNPWHESERGRTR